MTPGTVNSVTVRAPVTSRTWEPQFAVSQEDRVLVAALGALGFGMSIVAIEQVPRRSLLVRKFRRIRLVIDSYNTEVFAPQIFVLSLSLLSKYPCPLHCLQVRFINLHRQRPHDQFHGQHEPRLAPSP